VTGRELGKNLKGVLEHMHICFLANARSIHTQRWATYFANRGHEISIISRDPAQLAYATVYAPTRPGWLIRRKTMISAIVAQVMNAIHVRSLVRRIAPDILEAFTFQSYGVLAVLSGFHPMAACHLGDDGISYWSEVSLTVRFLVKLILKKADLLHTFDQAGRDRLIELGGNPYKISINPWGVHTSFFTPTARSEELCGELGCGSGPVVTCIRHLEPQYDVQTYIRSMPLIEKEIPGVRFVLIGDGTEAVRLQKLASDLGVRQFQHLGYIQYENLPKYLASCDVYVDPVNKLWLKKSRTWFGRKINLSMAGLGYTQTLLAAMSCQVAPVVTERPGIREIISEGYEKYLFSPGDEADLARKVVQLLDDEIERKNYVVYCRKKIQEVAEWEVNALRMEEEYRRLVNRFTSQDTIDRDQIIR